LAQAKVVQGHVHVTEGGASTDQTGPLGGHQAHPDDDVVFILVVLEDQLLALAFSDGQRVSLTGRRCSKSRPDRGVSRSLETDLLETPEFGDLRRHEGSNLAGEGNGGK
jgi:hypothetical protein